MGRDYDVVVVYQTMGFRLLRPGQMSPLHSITNLAFSTVAGSTAVRRNVRDDFVSDVAYPTVIANS